MRHSQRIYAAIAFSFSFVFFLLSSSALYGQGRNSRYIEYIDKYSGIAVSEMQKSNIPASITLAQGILESGAGQSALARNSNNHFGIKCGSSWTGRSVKHDDDARDECFRAYSHPKESYEDHSRFLTNGARYAFLFKLKITDYRGWANGLKKAGYATDPSYANRLITIIEDYELYKYDQKGYKPSAAKAKQTEAAPVGHQVYLANDMAYIVARYGDTFKSLAKETGISWRKLVKYNDLHREYTLMTGDVVYLCKKNKKAPAQYTVHIVRSGDSMHSISQMYGIRLKELYKMNRLDPDYVPEVGQRLRLR